MAVESDPDVLDLLFDKSVGILKSELPDIQTIDFVSYKLTHNVYDSQQSHLTVFTSVHCCNNAISVIRSAIGLSALGLINTVNVIVMFCHMYASA